jgi:hypothetical protein
VCSVQHLAATNTPKTAVWSPAWRCKYICSYTAYYATLFQILWPVPWGGGKVSSTGSVWLLPWVSHC